MLCGYKRVAEKWAVRKSYLWPAGRNEARKMKKLNARRGFVRRFRLMIASRVFAAVATCRASSYAERQRSTRLYRAAHCNLQAAFAENRYTVVFREGHWFAGVQSSAKDVDDAITDICGRCNDTLRVARSPVYPIISWRCEKKTVTTAFRDMYTYIYEKKNQMYAEADGCRKICETLASADISYLLFFFPALSFSSWRENFQNTNRQMQSRDARVCRAGNRPRAAAFLVSVSQRYDTRIRARLT